MLLDIHASDNSEYLPTDLMGLAAPTGVAEVDPLDDDELRAEFEMAMVELELERDAELAAYEAETGLDLAYEEWRTQKLIEERDLALYEFEQAVSADLRKLFAYAAQDVVDAA